MIIYTNERWSKSNILSMSPYEAKFSWNFHKNAGTFNVYRKWNWRIKLKLWNPKSRCCSSVVKLSIGMPLSPVGVPGFNICLCFRHRYLLMWTLRVSRHNSNSFILVIHVGYLDGIPGSWHQPIPALVVAIIWRNISEGKRLSLAVILSLQLPFLFPSIKF